LFFDYKVAVACTHDNLTSGQDGNGLGVRVKLFRQKGAD
jgi:hypothetical protein